MSCARIRNRRVSRSILLTSYDVLGCWKAKRASPTTSASAWTPASSVPAANRVMISSRHAKIRLVDQRPTPVARRRLRFCGDGQEATSGRSRCPTTVEVGDGSVVDRCGDVKRVDVDETKGCRGEVKVKNNWPLTACLQ